MEIENHKKVEMRRTANYKPNIWNYDQLLSLTTLYTEDEYKREAETHRTKICGILGELKDPFHKLEIIDIINKLALNHYFNEEINQFLTQIACCNHTNDPYYTALLFRIVRQYGYHSPQDRMIEMIETEEQMDEKAANEIFEACHLALENESMLFDSANRFSSGKCALHWTVSWYNVKKHVNSHEKSVFHDFGVVSFNMVQLQHQNDLKEILRWWRNLGISQVLTFTRDRVVESFLWAVGVAYEPQYSGLRKWLTKAILLVLIIDDVYDIYGSRDELEHFTIAVERWDPSAINDLPEAIKKCFWALYDTVNDVDREIQQQKGWISVLPHLKKVWIGFCKALHMEANWYHNGHFPSLKEYLDNGWISSSGPVLSLHILFGIGHDLTETITTFNQNHEIVHHASMIIRLCNDQGTSNAELERGDAPSSILCYMIEANAGEEEARKHVKEAITDSWKKINGLFIRCCRKQQEMMKYVVNTARVANFIYQNGDGFGVQDKETREQVLSCLIHPLL